MHKINRPTKQLFILGIISGLVWLLIYIFSSVEKWIDPEQQAIIDMHNEIGTINSTIDLNSDEWNKLQEELDAETRRIQSEQALLEKENDVLRERKKELQTQLVDDPAFISDFTQVSEVATWN